MHRQCRSSQRRRRPSPLSRAAAEPAAAPATLKVSSHPYYVDPPPLPVQRREGARRIALMGAGSVEGSTQRRTSPYPRRWGSFSTACPSRSGTVHHCSGVDRGDVRLRQQHHDPLRGDFVFADSIQRCCVPSVQLSQTATHRGKRSSHRSRVDAGVSAAAQEGKEEGHPHTRQHRRRSDLRVAALSRTAVDAEDLRSFSTTHDIAAPSSAEASRCDADSCAPAATSPVAGADVALYESVLRQALADGAAWRTHARALEDVVHAHKKREARLARQLDRTRQALKILAAYVEGAQRVTDAVLVGREVSPVRAPPSHPTSLTREGEEPEEGDERATHRRTPTTTAAAAVPSAAAGLSPPPRRVPSPSAVSELLRGSLGRSLELAYASGARESSGTSERDEGEGVDAVLWGRAYGAAGGGEARQRHVMCERGADNVRERSMSLPDDEPVHRATNKQRTAPVGGQENNHTRPPPVEKRSMTRSRDASLQLSPQTHPPRTQQQPSPSLPLVPRPPHSPTNPSASSAATKSRDSLSSSSGIEKSSTSRSLLQPTQLVSGGGVAMPSTPIVSGSTTSMHPAPSSTAAAAAAATSPFILTATTITTNAAQDLLSLMRTRGAPEEHPAPPLSGEASSVAGGPRRRSPQRTTQPRASTPASTASHPRSVDYEVTVLEARLPPSTPPPCEVVAAAAPISVLDLVRQATPVTSPPLPLSLRTPSSTSTPGRESMTGGGVYHAGMFVGQSLQSHAATGEEMPQLWRQDVGGDSSRSSSGNSCSSYGSQQPTSSSSTASCDWESVVTDDAA